MDEKLKCGHTMDAWFFRDEESGHGECAVCALPKVEAALDVLVTQLIRVACGRQDYEELKAILDAHAPGWRSR